MILTILALLKTPKWSPQMPFNPELRAKWEEKLLTQQWGNSFSEKEFSTAVRGIA